MNYLKYTVSENPNLKYANEEHTLIDLDVYFPHLGETVRYTCAPEDPGYEHSVEMFNRAIAGEFGPIEEADPPRPEAPDYALFWEALIQTNVYTRIRQQSMTSLPMNALATEFIALISDAKSGRVYEEAIRQSIGAILMTGDFTVEEMMEFQGAITAGRLETIYNLGLQQ
jgi:hypothetical protein